MLYGQGILEVFPAGKPPACRHATNVAAMSTTFQSAESLLQGLGVSLGASETHGIACGLLCSQPSGRARARWLAELLEISEIDPAALDRHAGAVRTLDAWFTETLSALNATDFEFSPLLPDDDEPFASRMAGLSAFCAGFGYGFGIGSAGSTLRQLGAESRELLEDFQSIESVAVAHDDQDEAALAELLEYVRVGVMLIHEERQAASTARAGGAGASGPDHVH